MPVNILFARPCLGEHRCEVGSILVEVTGHSLGDKRINDVIHLPIKRVPVSVGRNCIVAEARSRQCELIFMLDEDMWPAENFYRTAVNFLLAHDGPAAIASPYVMGAPDEKVNVFEYTTSRSAQDSIPPNVAFVIDNIPRNDAALRTGIERIANVGTGYIAYKTSCFAKIKHPYFEYCYSDETHTKVVETEDCWCHRKFHEAAIPMYVSWDHWSMHRKEYWAEKPKKFQFDEPGRYWVEIAREQLLAEGKLEGKLAAADKDNVAVGRCSRCASAVKTTGIQAGAFGSVEMA